MKIIRRTICTWFQLKQKTILTIINYTAFIKKVFKRITFKGIQFKHCTKTKKEDTLNTWILYTLTTFICKFKTRVKSNTFYILIHLSSYSHHNLTLLVLAVRNHKKLFILNLQLYFYYSNVFGNKQNWNI